ncbi:unnamed protein product [Rhizoctonia solani]|uniref:MYND-type domain-containing protein n=1 Tax=Rhizoctonia solani TaxID=456999 RepID=A0A8H3HUH7_9AGAM|nr:unnamed protein product [Rhizoctonia solani]
MGNDEPQWGPKYPQYSAICEDSIDVSFDRYMERKESLIESPHDLIPLRLLETALAIGENMHKVGFHSGNKIFPVLLKTIRKYTDIHKGEIFSHYYGFLCVRHLIRMICISTLTKNEAFDSFLQDIKPNASRITVSESLAEKALGFMTEALYTEDLSNVADTLGCSPKTGTAFMIDGGLSFRDVRFLVDVIWKSRKAIIPLRRCGLLPGLPALVFVLCEMIIISNTPKPTRPWSQLRDILLRCYLGDTTLPGRGIMRQLAIFIHHRIVEYNIPNDYVPVDQEDFCAIAGAWIDMLTPPLDLALAPVMLLDVSMILYRWVFCLMANMYKGENRLVAEWLAPAIMEAGCERLRLEIDREWDGPMPLHRCAFTRNYAAELFGHTSMLGELIKSSEVKDRFVRTLYESGFHELAGRTLLLLTRESFDDITEEEPENLLHYIESLDRISAALATLPTHPDDLSEEIFADWFKVNEQISHYHFGLYPSSAPHVAYESSLDAWGPLLPKRMIKRGRLLISIHQCSYPRCADPTACGRHPEAKTVCQRCGKAWYCSRRCQQMHHALHTIDSHLVCW